MMLSSAIISTKSRNLSHAFERRLHTKVRTGAKGKHWKFRYNAFERPAQREI
jgi:hypothetical protein